jgi:adenine-specific DNA-methyltransferase
MEIKIAEKRILWPDNPDGRPRNKLFMNEMDSLMKNITSLITKISTNDGTKEVASIIGTGFFTFPKPVKLIQLLLNQVITNDEIVLDFFAGSGTTAHAVMDLNLADGGNRKYICVQLPELTDEKSEAYKAGYKTIADISKERIRRAGKKIQEEILTEIKTIEVEIKKLQGEIATEETKVEIQNLKTKIKHLKVQDLGFKVLKLEDSNFKQWQQIEGKDAKALAEQMKLFVDPVSESATIENMAYELLLKSGKDLNSQFEKKGSFFKIKGSELILILEKATQEIIETVIAEKPMKVIALDKLFKGNDQLKTNTVLQMKDAGIEFKTI